MVKLFAEAQEISKLAESSNTLQHHATSSSPKESKTEMPKPLKLPDEDMQVMEAPCFWEIHTVKQYETGCQTLEP